MRILKFTDDNWFTTITTLQIYWEDIMYENYEGYIDAMLLLLFCCLFLLSAALPSKMLLYEQLPHWTKRVLPPSLLRCNWHTALCNFKVHSIMIWLICIHHEPITTRRLVNIHHLIYESLIRHMICKYSLPFSELPFHFVAGFLCCAEAF